jgi:DNA modification methylase
MPKQTEPKTKISKTELVWPGKRTKVEPVKLPFQTIETINLPRGRRQEGLFDQTLKSSADNSWKNRLIWGDNFLVMGSLLDEFSGKINLIYIDPPFATGADFSYQVKVGDQEWTKEPSIIETLAYRDTWGKGLESYLQMMSDRLVLMKELLADDGSIYVHLDYRVIHYIKAIMDEIFGKDNFVNEIIWTYTGGTDRSKGFQRKHDTILLYSKTKDFKFNIQFTEFSESTLKRFNKIDEEGRRYKENKLADGRLTRTYMKDEGKFMTDYWYHNIIVKSHLESTGYATQKPQAVLETIINASSDKGDLVADFFCGSGTTGAVAEKLGRRWIMCDLGRFAIHTTRKRLLDIKNCKPFLIQNLGKYERHRWMKINGGYKDYLKFILELYKAEPVEGFENLHGKKGSAFVHIGAVDAPVTLNEVNQMLEECQKNNIKNLDVLGWEWEMGLHDLVRDEAKKYEVRLKTLQIPREVMDIDPATKAEVNFYELAFLDLDVEIKDRKATVTLKDFILENPGLIPQEIRDKVKNWSDFIDYWSVDWNFDGESFHNMNQEYRTRKEPKLILSMNYEYPKSGEYKILVKVIDIFGNDTTKLVEARI